MKATAFANDWTAAGETKSISYTDCSMPRLRLQTDPHLIAALPPSPFPPLKEATFLSRLGQPPWRPRLPWAFVGAFTFTALILLVVISGGR